MKPASEELRLRILGQSQDVACELELVPAVEGAGCAALADQHGALAVMTVREPVAGAAYEVVVCDAVADTEQVRSVTLERGDALGTSAAHEAVALVVRSALVDLAAAHDARRAEHAEREQQARDAREARAAEEQRRLDAQRVIAEEERARDAPYEREGPDFHDGTSTVWWLAVGGEAVLPAAKTVAPAVHARLLAQVGFARVGLGGSFGFAADSRGDDDEARLSIARHTALALGFVPYEFERGWTLELGAHAGATAITRATRSSAPGVAPTEAATHWSLVFGVEIGLNVAVSEPFGLRPHLALDIVPGAPEYAYRDLTSTRAPAGEVVRSHALPAQPRLGLTLFAEL